MGQKPDKVAGEPVPEGQDNNGVDTDADSVVLQVTQGVDALVLGGAEKAALAEGTSSEIASAEATVGAAAAASGGDTGGGATAAVDGKGKAISGDDACATPCAEDQNDERAVLHILYDT